MEGPALGAGVALVEWRAAGASTASSASALLARSMAANLTPQQANEVLARVRSEVQQQTLQDLLTKISEQCFDTCVTKPGSKLSNGESKCLAMCMDRYIECFSVVSDAMQKRGEREG